LADQPINEDGGNGGRDSGIELFVGEDTHWTWIKTRRVGRGGRFPRLSDH
jgi:hypothetical protein